MKSVFLFCVFLFIVIVASDDKVCEPGSKWKEDCNSCFCTNDGTAKGCTRMMCQPHGLGEVGAPHGLGEVGVPPKKCEPNSNWKDECNTCWCNSDGTAAACTLKGCNSPALQIVTPKE